MYLTSLNQRIGDIAQKDFTSLDENTIIADAVRAMKESGISSVFVRRSPYSNSKQVTHNSQENAEERHEKKVFKFRENDADNNAHNDNGAVKSDESMHDGNGVDVQ